MYHNRYISALHFVLKHSKNWGKKRRRFDEKGGVGKESLPKLQTAGRSAQKFLSPSILFFMTQNISVICSFRITVEECMTKYK